MFLATTSAQMGLIALLIPMLTMLMFTIFEDDEDYYA